MTSSRQRWSLSDGFATFSVLGCLALLFMAGGGSRADSLYQVAARLASLLVVGVAAFLIGRKQFAAARPILLLLAAAVCVILVQLVPLPPGLWASLPGRDFLATGLTAAGVAPVWRPISFTPDLTLNSLLALLPACAAGLGLAVIDRERHGWIVTVLVAGILLSILIGIIQISTGSFYLHRVTNTGFAVGVMANRNHQAMLLACSFPLLACLALTPRVGRDAAASDGFRKWVALSIGAVTLPMLFVTGSRAGLGLGLAALLLTAALVLRQRGGARDRTASRRGRLALLIPPAVGIIAVTGALVLSRDEALRRLFEEDQGPDQRTANLPIYFDMVRDYFPVGSGFGSFNPMFRMRETQDMLNPLYVNHVHNDPVQLALEGGLPAMLLLTAFLVWYAIRSFGLWATSNRDAEHVRGRAGSVVVLLILLGSLVDYPLRTPLISFIFVVGCMWMALARPMDPSKGSLARDPSSANADPMR